MALAVEAWCNKTSLCSAVNKLRSMKEFLPDPLCLFFTDARSPGCLLGFENFPIDIIDIETCWILGSEEEKTTGYPMFGLSPIREKSCM